MDGAQQQSPIEWGHLPAVALQAIGSHCCPASRAKLRAVCASWHDALAPQFARLSIGPGSAWAAGRQGGGAAAAAAVSRAFPAATALQLVTSSTREYPASYTQDVGALLAGLPRLAHLSLGELHELDDIDTLDPASLWDALAAATPALAGRLASLAVSGCFWGCPELFGGLRQLTSLTQLRLSNTPLETACEVAIVAGLTQLVVLEFGLIYDGTSRHADVPRALAGIGALQQLQELSLPMWRRSLGGRAHPLAPSLAAALAMLTRLTSLAVDGKFGHLGAVSCLTNLRRLASAAPLSVTGWEAISKLPQLTLLTSLTPCGEALALAPSRPHAGLDLSLLVPKAGLQGLDVAVMQPEHLASLGQLTALTRLTLRSAGSFLAPRQQAALLTALSCLPASLLALALGPLLPLSPQLLTTLAHSCPRLASLAARFHAVTRAYMALEASSSAAAAAAGQRQAQQPQLHAQRQQGSDDMLVDGDNDDEAGSRRAVPPARSSFEEVAAAAMAPEPPAAAGASSISAALRRLAALRSLELVLSSPAPGAASEPGGSSGSTRSGSTGAGSGQLQPQAVLQLCDLPRGLQQLVLAGPWLLVPGPDGSSSARRQCRTCGGRAAAAAATDAAGAAEAPPQGLDSTDMALLCECMSGLGVLRIAPPGTAPAAGSSSSTPPTRVTAPAAAALAAARTGGGNAVDATAASAATALRQAQAAGVKRPGSSGPAAPSVSFGSFAASAPSAAAAAAAAAAEGGSSLGADVFIVEQPGGMEKRSRSFYADAMPAAAAAAAAAMSAAPAATQQQQQQQLPGLVELSLFSCLASMAALEQLLAAAGGGLSKLQLMRVHIAPEPGSKQQAQRKVLLSSATPHQSAELMWQQLRRLPVSWHHLQEWCLHPLHMWGLVRAGWFGGSSRSSSSDGGSEASSRQLHSSRQLINLRHLCVAAQPPGSADAGGAPLARAAADGDAGLAACLPMHDRGAMAALLAALLAGLAGLPALRQLHLELGLVVLERPELPDACGPELWVEAGERLLDALPCCRVAHHPPVVCAAAAPGGSGGGGAGAGTAAAAPAAAAPAAVDDDSDDGYVLDYVI